MQADYKKIEKALDQFTFRRDRITVFRDCVHILALELSIKTDLLRQKERIEERQRTLDLYAGEDLKIMLQLKVLFFEMLKKIYDDPGDHLGHIYMLLIPKARQSNSSQFFTPYNVSKLIALINLDGCSKIEPGTVETINDCCCGAGGMLVAACDVLKQHNFDYTRHIVFHANDIDVTCVEMTYLQLSFMGAAAVIEHKDTLTQKKWNEFRTFGYLSLH